jgi:hypothetical protein
MTSMALRPEFPNRHIIVSEVHRWSLKLMAPNLLRALVKHTDLNNARAGNSSNLVFQDIRYPGCRISGISDIRDIRFWCFDRCFFAFCDGWSESDTKLMDDHLKSFSLIKRRKTLWVTAGLETEWVAVWETAGSDIRDFRFTRSIITNFWKSSRISNPTSDLDSGLTGTGDRFREITGTG